MGRTTRRRSAPQAFGRGVLPVRRPIASESIDIAASFVDNIEPEIEGAGRTFVSYMLGVSVVAFSRFNPGKHHHKGPRTAEIARTIPSTNRTVEAEIGHLMVAGGGSKFKLAVELDSPELSAEEEAYSEAFAERGFKLRKEYNSPDGQYHPHLSLALLYNEHLGHFQDPTTLSRLDMIGEAMGETILLAPADFRS